jgi:hypothetical protein
MIGASLVDNQPEVRSALDQLLLVVWLFLWGLAALFPALSDLGEFWPSRPLFSSS